MVPDHRMRRTLLALLILTLTLVAAMNPPAPIETSRKAGSGLSKS